MSIRVRTALFLCLVVVSCRPRVDTLHRIRIANDGPIQAAASPQLVASELDNPMCPRVTPLGLVVVESGTGTVAAVQDGKLKPLITGFAKDQFAGYDISAQGLTVDPQSNLWIVAAAEGPGRILLFDPKTFPTTADRGRNVPLKGAVDDNPYATVVTERDRIIVASGGTKSAYQGRFDTMGELLPLDPAFTVDTGIIGITLDPRSGDVFGAIFGNGNGSVVRWRAGLEPVKPAVVASGLRNPVDVAFTRDGTLLVLEIGQLGKAEDGRVSVVLTDGSGKTIPFITGLDNPTGLSVGPDDTLYFTELGRRPNATAGTLISVRLARKGNS